MKKICAIFLTAAMLFLVSACNIKDVTKMASVGDEFISKGEYNFYLMQAKSQATSAASQNGDTISTDNDWNTVMIDDVTAAEYAKNLAADTIKQVLVLKAKAIADGETLTEEDLENVKTQRTSIIEQFGGRYNYEQVMAENGFTLEDIENIIKAEILGQKAMEKYFADDTVSDEDAQARLEEKYVFAKHILISSQPAAEEEEAVEEAPAEEAAEDEDATEEEAAPAEESEETEVDSEAAADALKEEAKAKAEDIIAQLDNGANFDTLMKANSADVDGEGNLNGADGYLFTEGEMVKEFETAAFALKEGEYTKEPVETTYGYHIILRLPLPSDGEEYDNAISKIKSTINSEKVEDTIDKWAEELGFSLNEKAISKIKL